MVDVNTQYSSTHWLNIVSSLKTSGIFLNWFQLKISFFTSWMLYKLGLLRSIGTTFDWDRLIVLNFQITSTLKRWELLTADAICLNDLLNRLYWYANEIEPELTPINSLKSKPPFHQIEVFKKYLREYYGSNSSRWLLIALIHLLIILIK